MKCERLVKMFKVVLDTGLEIILEQCEDEEWLLQTQKNYVSVPNMYDVAKEVLKYSDEMSDATILVPFHDDVIPINARTRRDEYFIYVRCILQSSVNRG